ncbi:hypothetical protein MKW92_046526, partial [Papaver armeniacum]
VLQEVPTQQNIMSTVQTRNISGVPHISPYGQVVNVAPQQLDNILYAPTYDGFQLHERAQETNVYHLASYPEHRYRPL